MKEAFISGLTDGFLFGLGAISAMTIHTVVSVAGTQGARELLRVLGEQVNRVEAHQSLVSQGEMIFSGVIAEA